jgi:hypothetical protein
MLTDFSGLQVGFLSNRAVNSSALSKSLPLAFSQVGDTCEGCTGSFFE